uniref:Uncharacterized protein n=1 Tax=viral metagenome TaxID=1070528 RepID=A0A6M3X669_9ZZZZ
MLNEKQIEDKIDMQNPKIGQRVQVFSNNYEELGYGTITSLDILVADETGEIISNDYPEITLDDGRKFEGLNCWWYPIKIGD